MRIFAAMLLLGAAAPGLAFAQTDSDQASQTASPRVLTASHARYAMTEFGCSNLHSVHIAPDGAYHGNCTKGGSPITVKMDKNGTVSQTTGVQHITEGRARYAMTDFGCTNISSMGTGPGGTWHAECTKAGARTPVMVDTQGVASTTKATHLTEPAARSKLIDYGCNNISSLTMGGDGGWYGQCTKAGSIQRVAVSSGGEITAK